MMMYYMYLIFTVLISASVTVNSRLVGSVFDIWKPVLILLMIFVSFILLHIIVLMLVSMFVCKDKKYAEMNKFFRWFSIQSLGIAMKLARIRIHVTGEELIPKGEKFFMAGNHCSMFDPMIAMYVFRKHELAFVSKKENLEIPFIGRLMRASGCVSLDRENNRSAVRSINQAAEHISKKIASMGIYPEGKINKTKEILLPFHSGSFKIAVKAKAPIVIAVMRNTRKIYKRFLFAPTNVYIDIVSVIFPEEYASMKTYEISKMARNLMYKSLSSENAEKC